MVSRNIVLIGDAAHTAHFGIGSGTKLAMEDAIALAQVLSRGSDDVPAALAEYQEEREIEALKLQSAARNRMEWFEQVERYVHLDPEQFTYSLLTGSQRIGHENLKLRDAPYVEGVERWFAARSGIDHPVPPMFTPFQVRGLSLKNRVIVSPMATYMACDGMPDDFHLVHLGARAMGGAAMVVTEMTCVSPEARITPACPGIWNDQPSSRPGSASSIMCIRKPMPRSRCSSDTRAARDPRAGRGKGWINRSNRPIGRWCRRRPCRTSKEFRKSPHEATRAEMDRIRADFVDAARRGAEAGFDWLEFHCAHGYLMSSFISPLTNHRTDEYGGSLENRCRYPLEVFLAMREVWPERYADERAHFGARLGGGRADP